MKKVLQILFFLTILITSCKKDETVVKFGGLKGWIKNDYGQPIEGALIKIESFSTKSNNSGEFFFNKLQTKEYSVSISKETYITKVENITITENEIKELNITLSAGEPYLNISDSILNINSSAGSKIVTINSNSGWVINNSSSWLVCSKKTGQGNETISIGWTENQELVERKDTIQFQSGQLIKNIIITQSAPIKLISFEGIIGNGMKDIADSVYLRFNKPIEVNSIQSNWEYCASDIKFNTVDNNCGIKFTFSCAKLGGDYPFTISVSDGNGNSFSKLINVPFYKTKRDFEGRITDFILFNNDKEMLISTFNPSRIIQYLIEKDSIIKTYDLSGKISPTKISYNPYNSKVYIMGAAPTDDNYNYRTDQPYIYTLNLQDGELVKAITIIPDAEDHPQYPANIPYNIGFTKFGNGIVLLKANSSSAIRWKVIDCTRNDTIYKYPFAEDNTDYFDNVQPNFDQSKLIMTQTYIGSCSLGVFDGNTQHVSVYTPSSVTRGVFITPNRKNENIYCGQLYDQFIINLNGYISQISYLDNRNNGSADFSYRENENNIIYFYDNDYLRVLDYNDAETLMWCDVVSGLKRFTSTIDGKYTLAYTSSNIYIFETKYFYRH